MQRQSFFNSLFGQSVWLTSLVSLTIVLGVSRWIILPAVLLDVHFI
jgi:hypothetical protein